jgi:Transposase DDE domain
VFERLHQVLLDELDAVGALDWSRVTVDSFGLRGSVDHVGANPVDRAKPGSKLHLAAEGTGLPLSVLVTGANTPDAAVFRALLDDIPKICTPRGGRRCRPGKVHADKAYDNRRCRSYLMQRRIGVRIARCGVESSARLGRHRWKVERSIRPNRLPRSAPLDVRYGHGGDVLQPNADPGGRVPEGLRSVQADESGLLIDVRDPAVEVLAVEQANLHGNPGLLREPKVIAPLAHARL